MYIYMYISVHAKMWTLVSLQQLERTIIIAKRMNDQSRE